MNTRHSRTLDFPELNFVEDEPQTRRMSLQELPRKYQIDSQMAIIRTHHPRIAKAIEVFWGHKECVDYMQQLVLNGDDEGGKARVGFKREVLSALINLTSLHELKESS